jgi:hypothetical protein
MVLLSDAVQFKKFDTRLVERSLSKGVLSSSELEVAVQQLPDDSENAIWVSVDSFQQDGAESEKYTSSSSPSQSG